MRFKSTGLGPQELKGTMEDLTPAGKDLLVLHIKTHDPVEWDLKAALEPRDIPNMVKGILKPTVLIYILRTLIYLKKEPKEPVDIMDKSIEDPSLKKQKGVDKANLGKE
jgi:hypothetical protein